MTLYDPQVRRAFERAAATYDAAAVVQREVVSRMAERLELIRLNPARILDLGSGTGQAAGFLRQRFPRAWVLEMDLAPAMLRHSRRHLAFWQRWRRRQSWLAADMHALPLATGSVDMVWSSMALQWARDLKPVLLELRRVLKPGGLLMFSSVGPDTFKELRQAFAAIDAAAHVNHFLDMHDVGDALLAAGFDVPVVDMEYLSLTYAEARDVMRDIKSVGAQRVTEGARKGLMGRAAWQKFEAAYEALRVDGKLPLTYEVVYGHAWAPMSPNPAVPNVQPIHFHRKPHG